MSEGIDATKAELAALRAEIAALKKGVSQTSVVDLNINDQDEVQTVDDPYQELLFTTGANIGSMPVSFRSGVFSARMINLKRIRSYILLRRGGV